MDLNRTPNELDRNARNGENDNWDKIEGALKDVKNVVDDFIGTVSDEVINELIDNAQLKWREFVDSYADLPTDAKNGDTVLTRDDGKVYRFDGSKWVVIQQIDINAVNEIEQRIDDKFTQKYDDVTTQLAQKANKDDYVFVGSLAPFPTMKNIENVSIGNDPRMIEFFDSKMWGYKGSTGEIFYSTDEGKTWTLQTDSWQTSWGWISRIIPTKDGEVMALCQTELRKSSGWGSDNVTWSNNKVTPNGQSVFVGFGFDGDGQKFVLVEYGNTPANWKDSRHAYISTDFGNTFNKVWDSVAQHGQSISDTTHLHAACYDKWSDRFYISEGHGEKGGIYYSANNGQSWHQAPGHRADVLKSSDGTVNGPTVMIATDDGLVMGSDNRNNGLFGLVRQENPENEVVTQTYKAEYSRPGLVMFAQRGYRDPKTGAVYITFRSEFNDVPPIICAGTSNEGHLMYEHPTLPVVGGQDRFVAIARTDDNRMVIYNEFNATPKIMRADLEWMSSGVATQLRKALNKEDKTVRSIDIGETTIPREYVNGIASIGNSNALDLTFFEAEKTETVKSVEVYNSANVGDNGATTLIKIAVYEEDSQGNLTLVASTPNSTNLFSTQNRQNRVDFSKSFVKKSGTRYAVGILVVTTASMPTFYGIAPQPVIATIWGYAPRKTGRVENLNDIPTNITKGQIGISSRCHFFALAY